MSEQSRSFRSTESIVKVFFGSVAVLIAITGAAKIASVLMGGEILEQFDPVFGLKYGTLFLVVGVIEVVCGICCVLLSSIGQRLGIIIWLSACFAVYRLGLYWVGEPAQCSCLGSIISYVRISPALASNVMSISFLYMALGSVFFATVLSLKRRSIQFVRVACHAPSNEHVE